MHFTSVAPETTVIGQLLAKFVAGDPTLFEMVAEDVDFRIDHFRDDVDTGWQQAHARQDLMMVMGRLGQEVFPQGTEALGVACLALGEGWHLTRFNQRFFYGVRQRMATSMTYIISHEAEGRLDYFRETVTYTANEG
jgi:hypothetical protein